MSSSDALQALVEEVAARVADLVEVRLEASGPGQFMPAGWRLLSVDETGEALRRSSRWVRQRAKEGSLAFVKLDGGALAFLAEDVETFVRARRLPVDSDSLADRLQWPRHPAVGAAPLGGGPVGNRRVVETGEASEEAGPEGDAGALPKST